MAQRRRRQLTRNTLIFLGSLVAHVGVLFLVATTFTPYRLPEPPETAIQVEIVPPLNQPPPPPPPPVPIVTVTPQPQPKPQTAPPQPQTQATPQAQPQPHIELTPAPKATAHVQVTPKPTPLPSPKMILTPAPSPLTPSVSAPTAGPPKAIARAPVTAAPKAAVAAPKFVLHRNRDQGQPLVPSVSIPGGVQAQTSTSPAGGGAPAGGGGPTAGGGLPGGALPGFGGGLRSGRLGCANAEAMHLSAAEVARCNEALGEGTRESPQMDPIDASRRATLNQEAATAAAAQKYRDSTPSGSEVRPVSGQPRSEDTVGGAGH